MSYPPPAAQVLLLACVITAAIWDVRLRRIPNWLTFSSFALGILLNSFLFGFSGLRLSLLGAGLALAIYVPLYLLRAMGAGDVKLMAGLGAIIGAANWFALFILTGLVGGLCALLMITYKKRVAATLWNVGFLLQDMIHFRAPYLQNEELDVKSPKAMTMPHGLIIAIGAIGFLAAARLWAPR